MAWSVSQSMTWLREMAWSVSQSMTWLREMAWSVTADLFDSVAVDLLLLCNKLVSEACELMYSYSLLVTVSTCESCYSLSVS